MGLKQKNEERIRQKIEFNINQCGYPFPKTEKMQETLVLEELIMIILTRFPEEKYIKSIPILLIKKYPNTFLLLDLASKNGVKNKVGYLIETACFLVNHPYLPMLLTYLRNHKDSKPSILIQGNNEFLKERTLVREQKWNLQGGLSISELRKIATKLGIKKDDDP